MRGVDGVPTVTEEIMVGAAEERLCHPTTEQPFTLPHAGL
jgi:hypothetical protein